MANLHKFTVQEAMNAAGSGGNKIQCFVAAVIDDVA